MPVDWTGFRRMPSWKELHDSRLESRASWEDAETVDKYFANNEPKDPILKLWTDLERVELRIGELLYKKFREDGQIDLWLSKNGRYKNRQAAYRMLRRYTDANGLVSVRQLKGK